MQEHWQKWLHMSLLLAKTAKSLGEVPIGAVLVENNRILATGFNQKEKLNNPLGHAELIAIQNATKRRGNWRLNNCHLFVSLEPCTMCCGAILESRIASVTFATADKKRGGLALFQLNDQPNLNHSFSVVAEPEPTLKNESEQLLKTFFRNRR